MKRADLKNTLHNKDCISFMNTLEANSLDLIVTSPPYFNTSKKYQRGSGVHYIQDVGEPLYVIEDTFELAKSKLKPNGFYCINIGFSYGETGVLRPFYVIERALKKGLFIIDVIIWKKRNPIPLQKRLTNSFEYIFVLSPHPLNKYPSGDRIGYQHNFIETSVSCYKGHSATFPLEIPTFCIDVFSNEGDLVYDPFMGSGTTALACVNLNRDYLGTDISDTYVKLARERIFKHKEKPQCLNLFN